MNFQERFLECIPIFVTRGVARPCQIVGQWRQPRTQPGGRVARKRKCRHRRGRVEAWASGIGIERVVFLYPDVVLVRDKKQTQRPGDRFERGLAFEQIDADREVVREKELFAAAEKLRAIGPRGAHSARDRQAARLELEKILEREVQENFLADDRRVPLELALQIRMPETQRTPLIRRFGRGIGIPLPATEADEPAVWHRFRARQQADAALGVRVFLIFEPVEFRLDLAHAAPRQAKRARQCFIRVFRWLRQDRRE